MRLGTTTKQPGERKWVSVQYAEALDTGDEINQVLSCTVDLPGLTATPSLATEKRVRLLISGGADGATYKITVRVATAGGEILEDELICRVKEV